MTYAPKIWQFAGIAIILYAFWSCNSEGEKRFLELSSAKTNIDFVNAITETEDFNILDYLYFYNGGGVASGDINNDGLPDLFFTSNQGIDKLYLNKGKMIFEDITQSAGVGGETGTHTWTTAATMVDINNDGFLDIYVCEVSGYLQLRGKNKLYISNGDLTFSENAKLYGLDIASFSQQPAFFDADLDGDLDLYLLNHSVHTPDSYKRSDTRTVKDSLAGDLFFINDNGLFKDRTVEAGIYSGSMGYGLSVNIADLNNDGYPDIYVGNDFHENDYLYYNNGNGTFREGILDATKHNSTFTMGADVADYDNDGWLDIFTLDMKPEDETERKSAAGVDSYDIYNYKLGFGYHHQYSRNMLQKNQGHILDTFKVAFSEIGQLKGVASTDWSWNATFADLDNNGYKDLFITNGILRRPNNLDFTNYTANEIEMDSLSVMEGLAKMPSGESTNYVFANEGGSFADSSAEWGLDKMGLSNGALILDLDLDGDQDIVINNLNEKASVFENQTAARQGNRSVEIRLVGPFNNKNGLGARVEVYAADGFQVQENKLTSGWLSSKNTNVLHFGLGSTNKIDSLRIQWPGGKAQTLLNPKMDGMVEVHYDESLAILKRKNPSEPIFKNISQQSGINFVHRENAFSDFNREKLIPRMLSTQGPRLAVVDVNGDGLDDFYICGAKGQPGAIYLQQGEGDFIFRENSPTVFEEHWVYEDAAAVFFDADGDGDPDLYVVSGGGELFRGEALQDRLYHNDGKGNFSYDGEKQLPNTEFNGSCAVAFDANRDGLTDLFVGNRSYPTKYGLPAASKFFLNRGEGRFTDASVSLLEDRGSIGMVTDAVWDAPQEQLIIVGEWMPVTIYNFKNGDIDRRKIQNTSGWWNSIDLIDIDGDGISEALLGNAGLNTDLLATVDEPLDLYVRDFDGNLSTDPIISYYKNGKRWPYPNLDHLASQIVNVKRVYRTYESYANSSFSEVFPDKELAKGYHAQVQTLASSYLRLEDEEYELKALPEELQYSAIFGFAKASFSLDKDKKVLAVGNFYGNNTAMGRSDASYGHTISFSKDSIFKEIPYSKSGFKIDGETRDIKLIKGPEGKEYILVSLNNGGVKVFARQ